MQNGAAGGLQSQVISSGHLGRDRKAQCIDRTVTGVERVSVTAHALLPAASTGGVRLIQLHIVHKSWTDTQFNQPTIRAWVHIDAQPKGAVCVAFDQHACQRCEIRTVDNLLNAQAGTWVFEHGLRAHQLCPIRKHRE